MQSVTQNGVSCVNNGDGTFTLDGIANAQCQFNVLNTASLNKSLLMNKKLVGCPIGGGDKTYGVLAMYYKNATYLKEEWDTGNGVLLNVPEDAIQCYIMIVIRANTTISNLTFKPMITNLNATYDDFVPYTGGTGHINSDLAALLRRVEALETK